MEFSCLHKSFRDSFEFCLFVCKICGMYFNIELIML